MRRVNRRRLLGGAVLLGAGATGLPILAACSDDEGGNGDDTSGGNDRNLRFAWWGNPTRDELTNAALDLYTERTGRGVDPEPSNWDDHWTSLSTQLAGGNPPDLMQHDYQRLAEYVDNGSLLALDDYAPDPIQADQIPADAIDSGRIDGALYAVPWGINTFALAHNVDVLEQAGEGPPDDTLTWSQFHDLAIRIGENTPDGVWGTENAVRSKEAFECWLHQRGKALYTAEGQLGFDADDFAEWVSFWMELVEAGACLDAEAIAESTGALEDRGVPSDTGAFDFHWSNIVPAFAGLTDSPVGVTMYPQGDAPGSPNGQYYKASMYLAVPVGAGDPEGAVDLLSALIFDPEVAPTLGIERGVPAPEPIREAVTPDLDEAELMSLEFVERVGGVVGPVPPPPPAAGPQVEEEFRNFSDAVGFGQLTIPEAADQFIETASNLLG